MRSHAGNSDYRALMLSQLTPRALQHQPVFLMLRKHQAAVIEEIHRIERLNRTE